MFYLIIAYDTPSDKRRNRMAKLLKGYGERRQYSLFEARLDREQLSSLKNKLKAIVDEGEDILAMYFLSPENLKKTWRVGHEAIQVHQEPDFV
ncbi:MAG: CRISPR-associated endonuclease Cas2 [Deinococcales bacterium]